MTSVPRRAVLSVSQLNREVRELLERGLPLLWVEGEISNLAQPASGHLYFSLKDSRAQIRCAMFKGRNRLVRFRPRNGIQVLVRGRISLYEPRGDYQLIVESMEEAGDGALRRQFEELKARLQAEGLFDASRKRPLPAFPRRLGVITSPTGAAIRDVLQVLRRRCPGIGVLIYPVSVQGQGAAERIAAMLRLADARREVDALLLTRGGGSLEDLWAFNEEAVARAVAACALPIVSAVGHETDFSISDFVADQRAPTPSAAAELLSPDAAAWLETFRATEARLGTLSGTIIARLKERLSFLRRRLVQQDPRRRLRDSAQRLDELQLRLLAAANRHHRLLAERLLSARNRLAAQAPQQRINQDRQQLQALQQRLRQQGPWRRIAAAREDLRGLAARLQRIQRTLLEAKGQLLHANARALEAVSPLATVARGYAIVRTADGQVVRNADSVTPGTLLAARLARGSLTCRVEDVSTEPEDDLLRGPRGT